MIKSRNIKFELAARYQEILETRVSQRKALQILTVTFQIVFAFIGEHRMFRLPRGLGYFELLSTPARKRAVPKVGVILVPKGTRLVFRAGKILKRFFSSLSNRKKT